MILDNSIHFYRAHSDAGKYRVTGRLSINGWAKRSMTRGFPWTPNMEMQIGWSNLAAVATVATGSQFQPNLPTQTWDWTQATDNVTFGCFELDFNMFGSEFDMIGSIGEFVQICFETLALNNMMTLKRDRLPRSLVTFRLKIVGKLHNGWWLCDVLCLALRDMDSVKQLEMIRCKLPSHLKRAWQQYAMCNITAVIAAC